MTENDKAVRKAWHVFEGWLFRECNEGTRRHLWTAFGLPVEEVRNHSDERHCLGFIRKQLSAIDQLTAERDTALSRTEQAETERDLLSHQVGEALHRAEQAEAALAEERKAHQAFRKEVSEAVENAETVGDLFHFILPAKPDPLVEIVSAALPGGLGIAESAVAKEMAEHLRAAIERAGGVKAVFGDVA